MPNRNTLGRHLKDANRPPPRGVGSAGIAPVVRLGLAGLLASCFLLAAATSLRAQESPEGAVEPRSPEAADKSPHDYTVSLRGGVWITWVDGTVKDTSGRSPSGTKSISIDNDLGFDDPTVQVGGSGNVRLGRHDFWVTGFSYDESENERVEKSLDFGDISVSADRRVVTDLEFTDVNFRYGYSFFDFEQHGFRLGPTLAVSYTSVDIELTDVVTGVSEDIDETFPAPTVGIYGEVPIGDFVLEGNVAGVYIEAGSFDGWAVRARTGAVWRPIDYFGLFAGFNMIYSEISLSKEDIDAAIFGPLVGLEVRF